MPWWIWMPNSALTQLKPKAVVVCSAKPSDSSLEGYRNYRADPSVQAYEPIRSGSVCWTG
jgi:hypothetical protein